MPPRSAPTDHGRAGSSSDCSPRQGGQQGMARAAGVSFQAGKSGGAGCQANETPAGLRSSRRQAPSTRRQICRPARPLLGSFQRSSRAQLSASHSVLYIAIAYDFFPLRVGVRAFRCLARARGRATADAIRIAAVVSRSAASQQCNRGLSPDGGGQATWWMAGRA